MIDIHTIVNNPLNSNCFVICDKELSNECLIIDPGSENCADLEAFLLNEKLAPVAILLTHEHFDHCWGCNYLQHKYNVPIVCSQECADRVRHHKTNYSVFYNPFKAFDIEGQITVIVENKKIVLGNLSVVAYSTPGHTDSSFTYLIGNGLFTGDSLIKGLKTVTKLPGGSRKKNRLTMAFLESLKGNGYIVYPGHGDSFELDQYNLELTII